MGRNEATIVQAVGGLTAPTASGTFRFSRFACTETFDSLSFN
jgi:hypothetical protein